ncbi:DUF6745 domain-containing protein [Crocosphaera chwakensis]|uniref:DUF6745 domain-containing protein n=1 Tax=Crocosphaera chwakensis CCY0110 TaxID=391612 RepID=A3INQ7_9CHRO|nr:hypothetical protein [Crocosphaera chwakensis]EAZ91955.1 hypothetical protein CY0110_29809 [Crocosphaera chwakensis CCY0110]
MNLGEPEIVFCDSPLQAKNYIDQRQPSINDYSNYHSLKCELLSLLDKESISRFRSSNVLSPEIRDIFLYEEDILSIAASNFYEILYDYFCFWKSINCELMASNCCEYDFYITELNVKCNQEIWNTVKYLCEECPYMLSFTDVCFVIEKPIELYLDKMIRLHREGQAAVKFIDGYQIYACRGIEIPEKYGKYLYTEWETKWFFQEKNCDLKIALLRGLDYEKFSQETDKNNLYFWLNSISLLSDVLYDIYCWLKINYSEAFFSSDSIKDDKNSKILTNYLPFKIPKEVKELSYYDSENIQLSPDLLFCCFRENHDNHFKIIGKNNNLELENYALPLFCGNNQEMYYILFYEQQKDNFPIWYIDEKCEPKICSASLINLMLSIAECYANGAYHTKFNEKTDKYYLSQDKNKVAEIFRKFNPNYINVWQDIWRKKY